MPFELTVRADSAEDFRAEVGKLVALLFGASPAALPEAEAQAPKATRGRKAEAPKAEAQPETAPETAQEPEAAAVTMEDLRAAMGDLVKLGAQGAQAAVKIVTDLKAFDAEGLPKIAHVKPEDFAACLAQIKAKTAELAANPAGVL